MFMEMLNLFRLGRQSAVPVVKRAFATEASALTTTNKATPSVEVDETTQAPDNSLYPNAPIRKFFEETRLPARPDGMPSPIPVGRPWFARELRLKSFEDLHKLHFVLLVERNKLLNEKVRHRKYNMVFPSPERLKNVRVSMARLQTVLTERADESAELKMSEALDFSSEKPELTEAQEKWFRAHEHLRKPAKQIPHSHRASGGQKTKRKMELAQEFEVNTLDYIAKLETSRQNVAAALNDQNASDQEGLGTPVQKPRWRNLAVEAQVRLHEKQRETRAQKLVRQLAQSNADKRLVAEASDLKTPTWADRPELAKLLLRPGTRNNNQNRRSTMKKSEGRADVRSDEKKDD